MAGLPQAEPQDMHENDPYLAPNMLPSPLMSPMESLQKENNDRIKMASFEPEQIKASAPMPSKAMKPSLPFTQPGENVEIPQDAKKAPTLEEILANLPGQQKDNELADAQKSNQDYIRSVLLARAGNKIGSSIAGVQADEKYGQDFADLSNKKVSDLQDRRKSERDIEDQGFQRRNQVISEKKSLFELGDKEKENDPNSDVSQAFREYMRSYAKMANVPVNIDDRMSMADLQKTTGMLGNIVSAKMAQDARRDNLTLMKGQKEEAAKDKKDQKNVDFMERQLNNIKKNSKNYKAAQSAESLVALVEDAIKNPSAIKEIAATYETIKSLDPDSAVREGEVGLLQQGLSFRAKLQALASKATDNPRVYGNEFLKTMRDYAQFKSVLAKKLYDKEFASVKALGKRRGMSDEDVDVMNPMAASESSPAAEAPKAPAAPTEIERRTKDGKIAIFDSNKKFLRYKE